MSDAGQNPTVVFFGQELLDRMFLAVELVRQRVLRSTQALQGAGIPCALCGSNATAVWIASRDESAVRQARNVELLLNRDDIDGALHALGKAGFRHETHDGRTYFLDVERFKRHFANEITFANEPSWGRCLGFSAPSLEETEVVNGFPVVKLDALVQLQLGRFRLDDAVDVQDMIGVGLIDASWTSRFEPELAARLQGLLDDPDG
jgi:hypothetical protein